MKDILDKKVNEIHKLFLSLPKGEYYLSASTWDLVNAELESIDYIHLAAFRRLNYCFNGVFDKDNKITAVTYDSYRNGMRGCNLKQDNGDIKRMLLGESHVIDAIIWWHISEDTLVNANNEPVKYKVPLLPPDLLNFDLD